MEKVNCTITTKAECEGNNFYWYLLTWVSLDKGAIKQVVDVRMTDKQTLQDRWACIQTVYPVMQSKTKTTVTWQ